MVLPARFRLYVFGSVTRANTAPNDVDLLLVYADGTLSDAHAVAKAIRSTPATPPYDVLVASETEATQLDLVAKQGAVPVWPANHTFAADSDWLGDSHLREV